MNMGRGYSFQQQQSAYAFRKESRQQSYAVHKEARYAKSEFHKIQSHVEDLQFVPSVCLDAEVMKHKAMFDGGFALGCGDGWHGKNMNQNVCSHGFGGGKMLMPFGANRFDFNGSSSSQFLNHQHDAMLKNAMANSMFETFTEACGPAAGAMRIPEMRFENNSWGGDDHNYNCFDNDVKWKRNRYSRFEWTSRGI